MRQWAAIGVVALLVSCSASDATSHVSFDRSTIAAISPPSTAGTTSVVEPSPATPPPTVPPTVPDTSPALAPSQVTASTVERPVTPEPCRLDDLTMWTASIAPGVVSVRIRNDGSVWCDVDITGSPRLDPLAEPAIWLEVGDAATLVAAETEPGCDSPIVIRTLEFDVGGVGVFVPTALAVCSWRLTALYPVDRPTDSCGPEQLESRWFDAAQALVAEHVTGPPCRLGEAVFWERGDLLAWPATTVAADDCENPTEVPVPGADAVPCTIWPPSPLGIAEAAPALADRAAGGNLDLAL